MDATLSTRLAEYLRQAESVIYPSHLPPTDEKVRRNGKVYVGADLGTAYLVIVVLNEDLQPIAGEYQFAQVVRDGLVVDYLGAIERLKGMKERIEKRLDHELTSAASAHPPGVPLAEVRATANVLEAAGLDCIGLVDEPTAANNVLNIQDGAVVDIGGGTTGIAIVKGGKIVYSADEATGGTHFTLVIAGAKGISFEEAEEIKVDPRSQEALFPLVRPVMEKVANIIYRHVNDKNVDNIYLVGGAVCFPGMVDVVQEYTGIATHAPQKPLFITPLGIAIHHAKRMKEMEQDDGR